MRCLICNRETFSESNPNRPFCSERCKLIDLDNWLSGRYRISTLAESREKAESTLNSEETLNGDVANGDLQ